MPHVDVLVISRSILIANSTITDVVGENPARVYPEQLPKRVELPSIVLDQLSGTSVQNISGGLSGMAQSRVRVRAYDERHIVANDLRERAVHVLVGHRGNVGGWFVHGAELVTRGSGVRPPVDGDDVWRRYLWFDVMLTHQE